MLTKSSAFTSKAISLRGGLVVAASCYFRQSMLRGVENVSCRWQAASQTPCIRSPPASHQNGNNWHSSHLTEVLELANSLESRPKRRGGRQICSHSTSVHSAYIINFLWLDNTRAIRSKTFRHCHEAPLGGLSTQQHGSSNFMNRHYSAQCGGVRCGINTRKAEMHRI